MQSEIQRKVKSIDPSKIEEVKILHEKYKKDFETFVVKYQKELTFLKLRKELKAFDKDVSSIQKEIESLQEKKIFYLAVVNKSCKQKLIFRQSKRWKKQLM